MTTAQTDRFVHDRLPPREQWPELRYDLPEFEMPEQLNIVTRLLDDAIISKGFANHPLLRSAHTTFTYSDVQARVNRIAHVLIEDCKLTPGNRVLLRGGNSIGMALAWLAVVKAGLIAVTTMPLLRAKELIDIIDKAQPQLAICDHTLIEELTLSSPGFPVLRFNAPEGTQDLGQVAARHSSEFNACPTSADDVAMMAFTSGTTGKPKAAVHLHRDLACACEAWPRHVLRATPQDIVIGSPPLAFTFGLGGLLLFPMWAGASVYFHDKPYTPEVMIDIINQTGATISYTAPTFYRQMAAFAKTKGVGRLRLCVSAGEGLPAATRQLWKDASGIDMLDGIGATELFHIFISSVGADITSSEHGTPIGKAVPGYTARVVDDAGREVARGTIGKLAVIGPTGCKYLDDSRQSSYVKGGWNHPGDAFVQDVHGYFFYQARADDMIISAGYNIGGPEVEDCLLQHPAVAECGVIGQPDDERGMIVKAFVVLKDTYTADEVMAKNLQDHVKAQLAPYKYPREIEFRSNLPRTETGKLQRFKLRQA